MNQALLKTRYAMYLELFRKGHSIAEVAERSGVTQQTVERALKEMLADLANGIPSDVKSEFDSLRTRHESLIKEIVELNIRLESIEQKV